ncbi:glycosyltransferase family 2 protein [Teredinibacter turnerae]|uniref:glycosyltransferase family 2 protein n=1 Tax=Teredinibacter turnerae TaxID=2426 RepID=UPI0003A28B8C|nr:glycosyltransferase family 2 protein [Teredinibacter turnerae]
MSTVSAFVLTFNESLHIERCISSLSRICKKVYVIDSYSTDNTVDIAVSAGAEVFQNSWVNHANQVNWAIKNLPIETEWVMRLDADEYLTEELAEEMKLAIKQNGGHTHYYIKRKVIFMGRWIKHGGYYPTWLLRLWRHDSSASCESRLMDEHIKVQVGSSGHLREDIVDCNLNDLTWWIQKHNRYATNEAIEVFKALFKFNDDNIKPSLFGTQERRKRWFKSLYAIFPLFVRPLCYFVYRYFLLAGFLDGKQGVVWHFMQGLWYRFLVDAKIFEIKLKCGDSETLIKKYIFEKWGVKIE